MNTTSIEIFFKEFSKNLNEKEKKELSLVLSDAMMSYDLTAKRMKVKKEDADMIEITEQTVKELEAAIKGIGLPRSVTVFTLS